MAELRSRAGELVAPVLAGGVVGEGATRKVFHPRPRGAGVIVHKEDAGFVVMAPELERIVARVDMSQPVVYAQVKREMDKLGVSQALKKAGAKPGDRVRCGSFEWTWA
jgi:Obg family GTPase CgtA-like protein